MSAPIDLTAVQQAARDTIAAHSYFATKAVLLDNGVVQDQEEAALNGVNADVTAGECVTVLPLLDGELTGMGASAGQINVGVGVRYAVNPQKSATDPLELMKKGTAALLGYSSAEKRNNFKLAQKAFLIDVDDQGCRAFTAFYEKLCEMKFSD